MGAVVAPLIGLATAGISAYATSRMLKNNQNSQMASLQSMQNTNYQNAVNTLPTAPEAPTNNAADAATNEAEAERQKQLAAMAKNEAAVNPTGGLGVTTQANTKKKTLGGGS